METLKRTGATLATAEFVAHLQRADLPADVAARAKELILDHLATALAGSRHATARLVRTMTGFEPHGDATVIGTLLRGRPADVATANATAAHSVEMDDLHAKGVVHVAAPTIPAALAIAEAHGLSGSAFVTAVVAGYEVMCRIGMATVPAQMERGFHPTATVGPFGAAAAVASLLALDTDATADAFGIAGSLGAGLREWKKNGSATKPFQVGRACRTGVEAALYAQAGLRGPHTVLEGEQGFAHAYAGVAYDESLVTSLGSRWETLRVGLKPHASCRGTHPAIDGVLELLAEHGIGADDVQRIDVGLPSEMYRGVMWPEDRKYRPESVTDAQFSLPFCLASAVFERRVDLRSFAPERLRDERTLELASRVHGRKDASCDAVFPSLIPAVVTIHTTDGRTVETRIDEARGEPENPVDWDGIVVKFLGCADGVIPSSQAHRAIAAVAALDEASPIGPLCAALRAATGE